MKYLLTIGVLAAIAVGAQAESPREQAEKQRLHMKEMRAETRAELRQMREAVRIEREQWNKARELRRTYRSASKEEKEKLRAQAPEFLKKNIDRMIARLERVKAVVRARSGVSKEQAEEIIANIDRDLAYLRDKRNAIDGADADTVRAQIKDVRARWKKSRAAMRQYTHVMLTSRVETMLKRTRIATDRLTRFIAARENAGADVTTAKSLLSDYTVEITAAREQLTQVNTLLSDTENVLSGENRSRVRELLRSARKHLSSARSIGKKIVASLRESA